MVAAMDATALVARMGAAGAVPAALPAPPRRCADCVRGGAANLDVR